MWLNVSGFVLRVIDEPGIKLTHVSLDIFIRVVPGIEGAQPESAYCNKNAHRRQDNAKQGLQRGQSIEIIPDETQKFPN